MTHAYGGVVRFDFSGDLWEMEDQRNWTDASYKSASTPASLGYHHEAAPARVRSAGRDPRARLRHAAQPPAAVGPLTLTVRDAAGPAFPPVGLRCSDPGATLSAAGRAALRTISPAHLRVDVNLAAERAATISRPAGLARELDCGLELAVFVPGRGRRDRRGGRAGPGVAAATRPAAARAGPGVRRRRGVELGDTVTAVRDALADAGSTGVPVIGGTNIYFNELNRHRLPPGPADGLAWSVNPQIHAFDDLSLMENLQAQPDTVATARFFAPGTAYFVTPITLRPRFNAVAVTGAQSAFRRAAVAGRRPPAGPVRRGVDPRQHRRAGRVRRRRAHLLRHARPGRSDREPGGQPEPGRVLLPAGHAVPARGGARRRRALAGGRICALAGLDPAVIAGIAVAAARPHRPDAAARQPHRPDQRRPRRAGGPPGSTRPDPRRAHFAAAAAADLPGFLESRSDLPVSEGAVTVTLAPYATARLDLSGE